MFLSTDYFKRKRVEREYYKGLRVLDDLIPVSYGFVREFKLSPLEFQRMLEDSAFPLAKDVLVKGKEETSLYMEQLLCRLPCAYGVERNTMLDFVATGLKWGIPLTHFDVSSYLDKELEKRRIFSSFDDFMKTVHLLSVFGVDWNKPHATKLRVTLAEFITFELVDKLTKRPPNAKELLANYFQQWGALEEAPDAARIVLEQSQKIFGSHQATLSGFVAIEDATVEIEQADRAQKKLFKP